MRDYHHTDQRDQQAHELLQPEVHVLADRAVQHEQPEAGDKQQSGEQRSVEI